MTSREIVIELLPHERAALLKWNDTPEVRSQLQACAGSDTVESIRVARFLVGWLASDLNHAIVKKGCRDDDVFQLAERFEYIEQTGDGSLDQWYF